MKAILIAEKPSLMREIQSAYREGKKDIPFDIDFLAQAGHLVGLKMPSVIDAERYKKWTLDELPIDVPYEYHVLEGKQKLVSAIKQAVRSGGYDFVIHAGDPDQEGELLVRETLEYVGNKLPVKRFWSNDLTHPAIIKALKSMRDDSEYDNLYNAALVRQHADYNFGIDATRSASIKMGELYRLGRVKAPIIRMVVDRELAIRNFVEKTTYKKAFDYKGAEFVCEKEYDTKKEATVSPAPEFCTVLEYKSTNKSQKAPKLFKLSTLQQEAAKAYHFSGQKTLSLAQSLYEKKVTSYPRTNCEYLLSTTDIGDTAIKLTRLYDLPKDVFTKDTKTVLSDSQYVNDKACSEEGHTALIPTGNTASMSADEEKLYDLIVRRFLAIFCSEKEVHNVSAKAVEKDDTTGDVYIYSASETISPGYESVLYPGKKDKPVVILSLKKGERISPVSFHAKECISKPPARYNDGSIIKALDNPEEYKTEDGKVKYQIGTPATRANILEECEKTGYFTKKKGVFYATEKAEHVIEAIGDTVLFNVKTSGVWESCLDGIRSGKLDAEKVEKDLLDQDRAITEDIKSRTLTVRKTGEDIVGECPNCKSSVVYGKYGAYCSGKCGLMMGKVFGKTPTKTEITSILAGKRTKMDGLISKKGNKYSLYVTMTGVKPFSYVKDGKTVNALGLDYETEFP